MGSRKRTGNHKRVGRVVNICLKRADDTVVPTKFDSIGGHCQRRGDINRVGLLRDADAAVVRCIDCPGRNDKRGGRNTGWQLG